MQLEFTTKKALAWGSVAAAIFVGSLFIIMSSTAGLFTRIILLSTLFLFTLIITLFPSFYLWKNRRNTTTLKTLLLLLISIVLIYLFHLGWQSLLNLLAPTIDESLFFFKNLFEYFE